MFSQPQRRLKKLQAPCCGWSGKMTKRVDEQVALIDGRSSTLDATTLRLVALFFQDLANSWPFGDHGTKILHLSRPPTRNIWFGISTVTIAHSKWQFWSFPRIPEYPSPLCRGLSKTTPPLFTFSLGGLSTFESKVLILHWWKLITKEDIYWLACFLSNWAYLGIIWWWLLLLLLVRVI